MRRAPRGEGTLGWPRAVRHSPSRALRSPCLGTSLRAFFLCLAILPAALSLEAAAGTAVASPTTDQEQGIGELHGSEERQKSAQALAAAEAEAEAEAGAGAGAAAGAGAEGGSRARAGDAAGAATSGAADGAKAVFEWWQKAEAVLGATHGRVAQFERELARALNRTPAPPDHDFWSPSTPHKDSSEADVPTLHTPQADQGSDEGTEGAGSEVKQPGTDLDQGGDGSATALLKRAWQGLQSLWPRQEAGDAVGEAGQGRGDEPGAEDGRQGRELGAEQRSDQGSEKEDEQETDQGSDQGAGQGSDPGPASRGAATGEATAGGSGTAETEEQEESLFKAQTSSQSQTHSPEVSHPQPQPQSQSQGQAKKQGAMNPEVRLAHRFIEANMRFPGARHCGAWATSFAALHTSIRSGKQAPRYVLLSGQEDQGMGDRMLGIVSSFLVALLTSRALVVNDSVLVTAFEPAVIDWRIHDDFLSARDSLKHEYTIPPPHLEDTSQQYPELNSSALLFLLKNGPPLQITSRFAATQSYVRFPRNTLEYFSRFDAAPILEVQTNGGVLTRVLTEGSATARKLTALGLSLQTAYPCILRFLMKPVRQVWEPITPTVVALGIHRNNPSLCVHMRLTDRESFDPSGAPQKGRVLGKSWRMLHDLFRCIQTIINRIPLSRSRLRKMRIFFMTGSREMREIAQQRKSVVVSPVVPQHVAFMPRTEAERRQRLYDTAKDWLLFSLCQYHMIDKSGFSKTAMAYSATRVAIYTHPRLREWAPKLGRCDGKSPDSLESVGAFWSGL